MTGFFRVLLLLAVGTLLLEAGATDSAHPRLFFSAAELPALQAERNSGHRALIWKNMAKSAEWCLTKTPRAAYIAPAAEDPVYENLYDRFYAMMGDMAITEHLAFAYALSGEARYGEAARAWTLATCRAWRPDAEAPANDGSAYAVMRMLKGVATAYDILYHDFSEGERGEIRDLLSATAAKYFTDYFQKPSIVAPEFHTHHAVVQFGSLGIVALALLGEAPEAQTWLDATTRKYVEDMLPRGLAPDGAQVEGATFWASTMHYRLFYMDALRRVTGRDLYKEFEGMMNADLALATIAGEKHPGWDEPHQTVIFEPPYGQLNYYAPVLAALAREYRRPLYQHLSHWDHTLGQIQQTKYITPNRGEQLLFELGGYAYLWYDASVPPRSQSGDWRSEKLSYGFPSAGQAYVRAGWAPGGIVAGVDNSGQVIVHAGGVPVFITEGYISADYAGLTLLPLEDDGKMAVLSLDHGEKPWLRLSLRRPNVVRLHYTGHPTPLHFWRYAAPAQEGNQLLKDDQVTMTFERGRVQSIDPAGHKVPLAVGNGLLKLPDPAPKDYPLAVVESDEGEIEIVIAVGGAELQ